MNILIVENEIYLAQKVVSRLLDDGHSCDFVEMPNDNLTKDYDMVLLSTSLPSELVKKTIHKFKDAIIILLVSYISDETVTEPINEGAKDYIMKPFIMDELVRKIYHFRECRQMRQELITMKTYVEFLLEEIDTTDVNISHSLPTLVETNSQRCTDKLAFEISSTLKLPIRFIACTNPNWQKELATITNKELAYLTDYHVLKKAAKENVCIAVEHKNCLISSLEKENDFPFNKIEFMRPDMVMLNNNIMTINDYVKLMVLSFQSKYPDTELSKKLGISRKSLWEKRKKLGIEKKK